MLAALAAALAGVVTARAETGYDLWLRYAPVQDRALVAAYRTSVRAIVAPDPSPTGDVAVAELRRGLMDLMGVPVPTAPGIEADGTLVLGTPRTSRPCWTKPTGSPGSLTTCRPWRRPRPARCRCTGSTPTPGS